MCVCVWRRRNHVCRWPVAYGINKNKWFRTVCCVAAAKPERRGMCFCLASKAKYRGAFNKILYPANETREKRHKKHKRQHHNYMQRKKNEEKKNQQNQMKAYIGQRVIKRCINVSLVRWKIYDKCFSDVFFSFFSICSLGLGLCVRFPWVIYRHRLLIRFPCSDMCVSFIFAARCMMVVWWCVCVHSTENLESLEETRAEKTRSVCTVIDLEIHSINIKSVSVDWNGNHICLCSMH